MLIPLIHKHVGLCFQDFHSSGYSWGKCLACDQWYDWKHLESDDHLWRVYRKKVHDNVKIYYPRSYKNQPVRGALLIDSFHYMVENDDDRVEYLPDVLQEIWDRTGVLFVAYCNL